MEHSPLYIVSVFVIVAFVAFTTNLVIKFQVLIRQNKKLYAEKVKTIELQYEKNVLAASVEMQETIRQYIYREIHDNINLSLALAKLNLNLIQWDSIPEIKRKVEDSVDALSKSITDLAALSKSISGNILQNEGLPEALNQEIERIRHLNLFTIDYTITGHPEFMDAKKELIVFRVIQESFNNIIKHSSATHASVVLHYTIDQLSITVKDNGAGFPPDQNNNNQGTGLNNMRFRVEMIDGHIDIQSRPGHGVVINIVIPVNEK